jgi:hypothetical protein
MKKLVILVERNVPFKETLKQQTFITVQQKSKEKLSP